jgi:hypothetical protein
MSKREHYFKDVEHLTVADVYRMIDLFDVPRGPIEHAFKKLAAAGQRGAKSMEQDVAEAIESLQRWQAMREENRRGGGCPDCGAREGAVHARSCAALIRAAIDALYRESSRAQMPTETKVKADASSLAVSQMAKTILAAKQHDMGINPEELGRI